MATNDLIFDHWDILQVGEELIIRGYRFKIIYIGEEFVLLEPIGQYIEKEQ